MIPSEDSPFLSVFGVDSGDAGSRLSSGLPSSHAASPEIAAYLSQLSSFGLERLTREPERLAEEKSAILEQTKELASQNYKTFIETAECSKEIFEDFVVVENRLGNLLEQKLPLCSSSCKEFQTQAEQISQKRKLNNQILQNHIQLVEILEVPQLIDTCVKNGHFDEALELANYIRRLEKKHGSQIPLVRSILVEVRNCIQSMVGQLIGQLRTARLTLPVCLKVIGHIRRLDAFSETELRVLFLNARDSWFQTMLASIPKDDAYNHAIKTVDATRVHLFDIVTQYKAIFTDDVEVRTSAKRTATGTSSFQSNDNSILYSWILEKVEEFLKTLTTDLASPSVEQRLDAIFNQCMYFGLSFGRVGIDLRPLLVPIFEETSLRFLTSGLKRGLKTFEDQLKLFSFTSSHFGTNSVLAMSLDLSASADLDSSSTSGVLVGANQPPSPPLSLLEFPPLASLYNDVVNVVNDFRPTATLDAFFPTKDALVEHLRAAARVCVAVFESLKNSFTESEAENFRRLCLLFVETLVPNVAKCFKCLFPSQQIAEALGVGIGDVHKSNILIVDTKSIRDVFDKETFPELAASAADDEEADDSKGGDVAFEIGPESDQMPETVNDDEHPGLEGKDADDHQGPEEDVGPVVVVTEATAASNQTDSQAAVDETVSTEESDLNPGEYSASVDSEAPRLKDAEDLDSGKADDPLPLDTAASADSREAALPDTETYAPKEANTSAPVDPEVPVLLHSQVPPPLDAEAPPLGNPEVSAPVSAPATTETPTPMDSGGDAIATLIEVAAAEQSEAPFSKPYETPTSLDADGEALISVEESPLDAASCLIDDVVSAVVDSIDVPAEAPSLVDSVSSDLVDAETLVEGDEASPALVEIEAPVPGPADSSPLVDAEDLATIEVEFPAQVDPEAQGPGDGVIPSVDAEPLPLEDAEATVLIGAEDPPLI